MYKRQALGGTCLNVGCIPSKALLESSQLFLNARDKFSDHGIDIDGVSANVPKMIEGKDKIVQELTGGIEHLFRANNVQWIKGSASLLPEREIEVESDSGKSVYRAENIILATGSNSIEIPSARLQGDKIVDSSGALDWQSVPEKLCVIGAGVIGLELGSVWRRLGSEVIVLEAQDVFLPVADQQIAKDAHRQFTRQGLDIRLGARVMSTEVTDAGVQIRYTDSTGDQEISVDRVIVAVGRRPNIDKLTLPEAGLLIDERGLVHVNEQCETNLPCVWAIGDLVRGPMLAHKGSEEGIAVAERIAGKHCHLNYDAIPSVIYTHPEISWVGKTEEELKEEGRDYKSGVFPFAASGRAKAMRDTAGMVKLLADKQTDELLGMHIIGAHSSELIGLAVTVMEFEGTSEDIARTVFAHPTLSEAIHESALAADFRALHIPNKKR